MYPQFYPYNMQQNQFQSMNQMQNPFIVRQVTSIDEAKAYIVDAFNSYLFVDFNAGKIYLKKMNNNGLSDFYIFTLNQEQKNDPFTEINQRLTNIENKLGGINNVQSNVNDAESNNESNAKSESSTIQKGSGNDERKK